MYNKTWTLLALAFLLCTGVAVAEPTAATLPEVVLTSSACATADLGTLFLPAAQAPLAMQGPPVCQVTCVTSQCSSHADCTAAPNGHCNFACPGVGCCVYR